MALDIVSDVICKLFDLDLYLTQVSSCIYRVSRGYCPFWDTPFLGHMSAQQAVLSRGDRALWRIWYFEKKFWHFFWFRVWARYKSSMVFRLSLVLSMVKFSAGIQLFGLKTTSHGKPDLKNEFSRSDLPCEVVFRPKSWIPIGNMNLTMLKTRLSQAGPVPRPEQDRQKNF